jgi:hypothetical protein
LQDEWLILEDGWALQIDAAAMGPFLNIRNPAGEIRQYEKCAEQSLEKR